MTLLVCTSPMRLLIHKYILRRDTMFPLTATNLEYLN